MSNEKKECYKCEYAEERLRNYIVCKIHRVELSRDYRPCEYYKVKELLECSN